MNRTDTIQFIQNNTHSVRFQVPYVSYREKDRTKQARQQVEKSLAFSLVGLMCDRKLVKFEESTGEFNSGLQNVEGSIVVVNSASLLVFIEEQVKKEVEARLTEPNMQKYIKQEALKLLED